MQIFKKLKTNKTTAIQAAYSMGYEAGQAALKEKIKDCFLKGGDSDAK